MSKVLLLLAAMHALASDNACVQPQAGAIHGLVSVLKDPQATLRALAHATFVLKRLTATKYISRASFVVCEGPQALMSILLRKAEHAPPAAETAADKGKG